MLVHI